MRHPAAWLQLATRTSVWGTVAALGLCFGSGCGGADSRAAAPETSFENPLSTISHADKPRLTLIRRDGDSSPAAAVAISHGASPEQSRLQAARLVAELRSSNFRPRARLFAHGLVVSVFVPPNEDGAQRARDAIKKALLRASPEHPSGNLKTAYDPCSTGDNYPEATVNAGAHNVSVAVVGPADFVDDWSAQHERDEAWPPGGKPYDPWPTDGAFETTTGTRDALWVALRSGHLEQLSGAVDRLSPADSALRRWASTMPPRWELSTVHASVRPGGGCLFVQLKPLQTPSAEEVAVMAARAERAMRRALRSARPRPIAEAALTAEDPRDAAELSAWQALLQSASSQGQEAAGTPAPLLVHLQSKHDAPPPKQLQEAFDEAKQHRTLGLSERVEAGRGQVWLALSSECPLAHEGIDNAGHTALALSAIAELARSGSSPASQVRSWTGPLGPMLIAHGPALQPGDTAQLAANLERGILAAFAESTDLVMAAHADAHSEPAHTVLELGARLSTGGHPADLLQTGTSTSRAQATTLSMRRALAHYLKTPLRLSVISNVEGRQAEQLRRDLEMTLAPFRTDNGSCPEPQHTETPGEYLLESEHSEADAMLFIPFPSGELIHGLALARMLDRPGGWLERALKRPGLVESFEVAVMGHLGGASALVFALRTEPDRIQDSTAQLRALLQRVGQARFSASLLARLTPSDLYGVDGTALRLLELAGGAGEIPPASEILRFAREHINERRAILVSAQQLEGP